MRKTVGILAAAAFASFAALADGAKIPPRAERMKWFTEARFGMFIHWGLYAEGGRGEWLMHNEKVPVEEYERKYFKHFNPDRYDPDKWAAAAAAAGMKYIVLTTKHHEGFCLWDSAWTDYKATNTSAKRDLLRPFVDACRRHGLRVGFYYSLLDWHHPQYIIDDQYGPYCNISEEERAKMNAGRDQAAYARYVHNQVKELLTGYGPVDIMWFDFSYPPKGTNRLDFTKGKGREAWESEKLYKMVTEINPNIILDDRMDLPKAADIRTPEQTQPSAPLKDENGGLVAWEACQTFSGAWGYARDELSWRTSGELIRTLIDCVAKNGNLLLNVGPTGRGEFDSRAMDRLEAIGKWMGSHSDAIYGCGPAPEDIKVPNGCNLTYNAEKKRLYVHLLSWPYSSVFLDGMGGRVEYARFLHDHSEVGFSSAGESVSLRLPNVPPAGVEVPVVEVFLKDRDAKKVLMIGNSFSICVGKNLPRIAASVPGCDIELTSLYIGGCPLRRHWQNVKDTEADASAKQYSCDTWTVSGGKVAHVNAPSSINAELAKGGWDVVTIQQASHESWDYANYQPFADDLVAFIRRTNPKAEIRIQQTWAYNAEDPRLAPGGEWGFDQAGMHERVRDAYGRPAKATGLGIIPSGEAVALFRERAAKDGRAGKLGDVVGAKWKDKEGKEHSDMIHLNGHGEYLQACVWFREIFGRDVPDSAYAPGDMTVGDAAFLRSCAKDAHAK